MGLQGPCAGHLNACNIMFLASERSNRRGNLVWTFVDNVGHEGIFFLVVPLVMVFSSKSLLMENSRRR